MSIHRLRSHEDLSGYLELLEDTNQYFEASSSQFPSYSDDPHEIIEDLLSQLVSTRKKAQEMIKIAKKFYKVQEDSSKNNLALINEIYSLQSDINTLAGQLTAQSKEIDLKDKQFDTMSHELHETEKEYRALLSETEQLRKDLKTLKERRYSPKAKQRKSLLKVQEDKEEEVRMLRQTIDDYQEEFTRKLSEIEELSARYKELEALLAGEKANSDKMKTASNASRKELLELKERIDELEFELDTEKNTVSHLQQELIKQKNFTDNLIREYDRERRASSVSQFGISNELSSFIQEQNRLDRLNEDNRKMFQSGLSHLSEYEDHFSVTPRYKKNAPRIETLGDWMDEDEDVVDDLKPQPLLSKQPTMFVLSSPVVNYEKKFQFPHILSTQLEIVNCGNLLIQCTKKNSAKSTFDLKTVKKNKKVFTFDDDEEADNFTPIQNIKVLQLVNLDGFVVMARNKRNRVVEAMPGALVGPTKRRRDFGVCREQGLVVGDLMKIYDKLVERVSRSARVEHGQKVFVAGRRKVMGLERNESFCIAPVKQDLVLCAGFGRMIKSQLVVRNENDSIEVRKSLDGLSVERFNQIKICKRIGICKASEYIGIHQVKERNLDISRQLNSEVTVIKELKQMSCLRYPGLNKTQKLSIVRPKVSNSEKDEFAIESFSRSNLRLEKFRTLNESKKSFVQQCRIKDSDVSVKAAKKPKLGITHEQFLSVSKVSQKMGLSSHRIVSKKESNKSMSTVSNFSISKLPKFSLRFDSCLGMKSFCSPQMKPLRIVAREEDIFIRKQISRVTIESFKGSPIIKKPSICIGDILLNIEANKNREFSISREIHSDISIQTKIQEIKNQRFSGFNSNKKLSLVKSSFCEIPEVISKLTIFRSQAINFNNDLSTQVQSKVNIFKPAHSLNVQSMNPIKIKTYLEDDIKEGLSIQNFSRKDLKLENFNTKNQSIISVLKECNQSELNILIPSIARPKLNRVNEYSISIHKTLQNVSLSNHKILCKQESSKSIFSISSLSIPRIQKFSLNLDFCASMESFCSPRRKPLLNIYNDSFNYNPVKTRKLCISRETNSEILIETEPKEIKSQRYSIFRNQKQLSYSSLNSSEIPSVKNEISISRYQCINKFNNLTYGLQEKIDITKPDHLLAIEKMVPFIIKSSLGDSIKDEISVQNPCRNSIKLVNFQSFNKSSPSSIVKPNQNESDISIIAPSKPILHTLTESSIAIPKTLQKLTFAAHQLISKAESIKSISISSSYSIIRPPKFSLNIDSCNSMKTICIAQEKPLKTISIEKPINIKKTYPNISFSSFKVANTSKPVNLSFENLINIDSKAKPQLSLINFETMKFESIRKRKTKFDFVFESSLEVTKQVQLIKVEKNSLFSLNSPLKIVKSSGLYLENSKNKSKILALESQAPLQIAIKSNLKAQMRISQCTDINIPKRVDQMTLKRFNYISKCNFPSISNQFSQLINPIVKFSLSSTPQASFSIKSNKRKLLDLLHTSSLCIKKIKNNIVLEQFSNIKVNKRLEMNLNQHILCLSDKKNDFQVENQESGHLLIKNRSRMMEVQIVEEILVDRSKQSIGLDSFKSIIYRKRLDFNKENHFEIETLDKKSKLIEERMEKIIIHPVLKVKSKFFSEHSNYVEVNSGKKEFKLGSFQVFRSENKLMIEGSSGETVNPAGKQEISMTCFNILNLSAETQISSSCQTYEPIQKEVFRFFNSTKSLVQLPQSELLIESEANPALESNVLDDQLSYSRFQIFSSKFKPSPILDLESTFSSSIHPDPESKTLSITSVLLTESSHSISIPASIPINNVELSSSSDSESSSIENFQLSLSQFPIKSHSSYLEIFYPDQTQCINFRPAKGKVCLYESKPWVLSIVPSVHKHILDFSETDKLLIVPAYTPLGNTIRVSTRLQLGRDPVKDFFILVRFT